jgi:hypothetical protein
LPARIDLPELRRSSVIRVAGMACIMTANVGNLATWRCADQS